MKKIVHIISKSIILRAFFVFMFVSAFLPGFIQNSEQWSTPNVLFSVGPNEYTSNVHVISDKFGHLHAFWVYYPYNLSKPDSYISGYYAIYYSVWDGKKWSTPVDILTSPQSESEPINDLAVIVDSSGRIHVIWLGASLYYSSAMINDARNVHAWSKPVVLAGIALESGIAEGPNGSLQVVYPAVGGYVYSIRSLDHGKSWSFPVQISTGGISRATEFSKIVMDLHGNLHVIWQENPLPEAYPPAGVYYSQSSDEGKTWSVPLELAGNHFGQPNIAVDGEDTIHVVWLGDVATKGRYHVYSKDGGFTWSQPYDITQGKGVKGLTRPPEMSIDGKGVVHLVFADDLSVKLEMSAAIGREYYTYWKGNTWAPLVDILGNESIAHYGEGPVIGIYNGNQVHILAPGHWFEIWDSYLDLAIPPLSTSTYLGTSTPNSSSLTKTNTPINTGVPPQLPEYQGDTPPVANQGIYPFIGVMPVVFLIAAVVIYRLVKKRS